MERECRGKTIREGGKPDFLSDFIFPPSLLVVPLLLWKRRYKPFPAVKSRTKQVGGAHTHFVDKICRACQKRYGSKYQRNGCRLSLPDTFFRIAIAFLVVMWYNSIMRNYLFILQSIIFIVFYTLCIKFSLGRTG